MGTRQTNRRCLVWKKGSNLPFLIFSLMPITPTADPLDEKRITSLHLSVWLQAHWIFNFKSYSIFLQMDFEPSLRHKR